jgi:hypothetical protein
MDTATLIGVATLVLMAAALAVTVWFSWLTVKAARAQAALGPYLDLCSELRKTLHGTLDADRDALSGQSEEVQRRHRGAFQRMCHICADLHALKPTMDEVDAKLWQRVDAQIRRLAAKPNVGDAWRAHLKKDGEVYDAAFVAYMQAVVKDSA